MCVCACVGADGVVSDFTFRHVARGSVVFGPLRVPRVGYIIVRIEVVRWLKTSLN